MLAIALLALAAVDARSQVTDYEVKAEFIERFTRFVEWPADHWKDAQKSFVIGFRGRDPLLATLRAKAPSWQIKGRPVEVREVTEAAEIAGCDLLFISGTEAARLEWLLERTADRPVLTVADTDGFGRRGVLINFYVERASVRFEINQRSAQRSGLEFRARLLKLARLIDPVEVPQ